MKLIQILVITLFTFTTSLSAQEDVRALFFNIKYGFNIPGADLADRFGSHFNAGLDVEYFQGRNNLFYGLQGNFIFGTNVEEDVLASLRTSEGQIIGRDMSFALVEMRQRGVMFGGHIGKLFPFGSSEANSGLRLTLGGGMMIHQIAIKDDKNTVNQVRNDYGKGYNRKTVGPYLHQFVGYQLLSEDRRINFRFGFTFHQGFTQSVRSVDFDTKMTDDRNRLDLMYGIELGWILPIFLQIRGLSITTD
nr:hypothetical protein [Saprospiraceae bacterium]